MEACANNTPGNAVEITNLEKSFGSARVLNGVSLTIKSNSILGLAGGNGAGKSTLAKCVAGHLEYEAGRIERNGVVAMVPQEFMLIPEMKVYENLFLGRELHRHGLLDKKEMIRRSAEALAKLGSDVHPEDEVAGLNVARRQMVELAKSTVFPSSVIIMDEPTTVLNRDETDVLFTLLRRFRDGGGSVIYITHRLYELSEICDEICIMRDGDIVFHGPAGGVTPQEVARLMAGRSLDSLFPGRTTVSSNAEPIMEIENVSAGNKVRDVSFSLNRGEILGLTGLAGAGRTELAETICGMRGKTSGTIRIGGEPRRIRSMHDAHRAGISYLSEDRQGTALLLKSSVTDNTVLASLPSYAKHGVIDRKQCEATAKRYVEEFHTRTSGINAPVNTLSGGNQQKVAIAKGLDVKPRVFIFDEPTRGVDVGARAEIYGLMHSLAADGMSCILISSDLEEVIGNCSRALVMRGGELAGELQGDALTEEEIMCLATGIK